MTPSRHFIDGSEEARMPQAKQVQSDYIIPMALEKEDDFDATEVAPAALLRLEIRYLRRDIGELKEEVRRGLEGKANRADLSTTVIDDHEKRLRAVEQRDLSPTVAIEDHEKRLRATEQRLNWAWGFGAAAGLVGCWIAKLLLH